MSAHRVPSKMSAPVAAADAPFRASDSGRGWHLFRGLGLALAPMFLFASIPVGLAGGLPFAGLLLILSLVLIGLDAVLFGRSGS